MQEQMIRNMDISESDRDLFMAAQLEVDLGARSLSSGNAEVAVTMFESAIQKIGAGLPFHDHLAYNLLVSYKTLIEQKLATGDASAAEGLRRRVLELELSGRTAEDDSFRQQFASVADAIGLIFFRHGDFDASLQCTRKAISIKPSPGFQVNLENALRASVQRARLSDLTDQVAPEQLGRHIFIACVPKSGSTFLKNVLLSLTGYRDAYIAYTPAQFEQDLYLPSAVNVAKMDTVTQQHSRATDANVQIMQAFGIRPVVLVRNIFDAVVSLLDFYNGGAFANTFFRADYRSLDEDTRIDLLIDNLVPWYFQFVASWSLVEKQQRLDIFWMSYEELIKDKPTSITNVLTFYGLGAPRRGIEQQIWEAESEKRRTRFNRGVAGRGASKLSEGQIDRIRSYARYFPTTDFSRIGL
jgi:tetratricopeptide (TPR) repeat protein